MKKENNLLFWEKTSQEYSNWISKCKLKDFFLENLFIYDFPIWWVTDLCNKDNVVFNKWFYQLKKYLYENKKTNFKKYKIYTILFIKIFKNFFTEIIWHVVIKIISHKKYREVNKKYCFNSINISFKSFKDLYLDMYYGVTPIKKNKNNSFYLINITWRKEFILNYFKDLRKFKKQELDYFFADECLTLKDIVVVYLESIKSLFKVIAFVNKNNKIFFIKNKNCFNILYPLLVNSFAGNIQQHLLRSISIRNFLKKNTTRIFINYGEFNPGYRSTYYFLKKISHKIKIVTIQHAYANKNQLFFRNKMIDFKNKDKSKISPMPDYYFVMGDHYKKILKEYYPGKVKIIGSLKYDLVRFKRIKYQNKSREKSSILLCPTVGDADSLIEVLNNTRLDNFEIIVSPHPAIFDSTISKFKKELKHDFKYFKNLSSLDLIPSSDLTLCGFSAMALETIIIGNPAIRIISPNHPYNFDLNDGLIFVSSSKGLQRYLNNFKQLHSKRKIEKITKNIFYKLDNNSYNRFWNSIPMNI